MKKELSRNYVREKIEKFFMQKSFYPKEVKKIKRLAMKYRIRLKKERKSFCRKCLSSLNGEIRITKTYKTVACKNCDFINRIKH